VAEEAESHEIKKHCYPQNPNKMVIKCPLVNTVVLDSDFLALKEKHGDHNSICNIMDCDHGECCNDKSVKI
jgi:hypothetical protein